MGIYPVLAAMRFSGICYLSGGLGIQKCLCTFQAEAEPSALARSPFCFLALHVEWVLSCRVQFDSRPNLLPHFLQPYGFSAS